MAAGSGAACSLLVLQPRRVAAVSLAARVAAERCEAVGEVVGYRIRQEAKAGPRTRISFVTTGVLLRRLIDEPLLRMRCLRLLPASGARSKSLLRSRR